MIRVSCAKPASAAQFPHTNRIGKRPRNPDCSAAANTRSRRRDKLAANARAWHDGKPARNTTATPRPQRRGRSLRNTAAARIDPAISYRSPSLPARIRPRKLQQLRYVIQVAESGSLTAAAEKLFVAQPSLSKAVSELEREMDITIFTRSRTGVVPTEEGMRFLSRARQVIEQADLLEEIGRASL